MTAIAGAPERGVGDADPRSDANRFLGFRSDFHEEDVTTQHGCWDETLFLCAFEVLRRADDLIGAVVEVLALGTGHGLVLNGENRCSVVQDEQVPGFRDAIVPGYSGASIRVAGEPGQPEVLEFFDDESVHAGQVSPTNDCCSCTTLGPNSCLGELLLSQLGPDPEVNGVRDAFSVSCVHGGGLQGREQFPGGGARAPPIVGV